MGKYSEYCTEMYLREDNPRRPGRAGTYILGEEYKGQEYLKEAPNMVEFMPITGNYMMMNGFPEGVQKKQYNMGDHKGGPFPKYNHGCDKTMIFFGTDTDNMRDLGAHIEFHLGEGEDAEVFHFDEPRAIYVPKNVRYGPIYITKFRKTVMMVNAYDVNTKEAADIENAWDYVGNDAKMMEVIGDDIELYKSFYKENPKSPLNPEGEGVDEQK